MKMIVSAFLIASMCCTSLFAGEIFSLEKAKTQVANDNIKMSIAYEQYVQIKGEAQAKTLQIVPTLSIDLLIYDYQYTILSKVIPEPSRFFESSAQKDLAKAADLNKTIVRKNLLEDVEKTFFLFQFHKEMIESLKKELEINQEIAKKAQASYDTKAIDFSEYYKAQREMVAAKTNLINGIELLKTEEYALKLILQVKDNTDTLDIESLNFYNANLGFPANAEDAILMAVNNSKEIEHFDYLVVAAEKQKKGVALSWISWSGVGFDYFAKVSIAKSEVKKIELNKKKTTLEIKNQVAALYSQIEVQKEKMLIQDELVALAQDEYKEAQTSKTELSLMVAEREASKLKYELELKFIKLKRVLGVNMITNTFPKK